MFKFHFRKSIALNTPHQCSEAFTICELDPPLVEKYMELELLTYHTIIKRRLINDYKV